MNPLPLSPRETTVLHLIAWGYTNKEIANRLNLSVKTVEAHKANAMRKLGMTSRADIVRSAVDWGWLMKTEAPGGEPPATN
jgi:DNA-binding NarL/FixJ family response regulator